MCQREPFYILSCHLVFSGAWVQPPEVVIQYDSTHENRQVPEKCLPLPQVTAKTKTEQTYNPGIHTSPGEHIGNTRRALGGPAVDEDGLLAQGREGVDVRARGRGRGAGCGHEVDIVSSGSGGQAAEDEE